MVNVQKSIVVNTPNIKAIDIIFENITYSVPFGRKGENQILKEVSGHFKSGELTAIMGPSGAGKTSLLNILTGFQTVGMKGTIKSNGSLVNRIGAQKYKKELCYILQDDQLAPLFTVFETMKIATNLKLGNNITEETKLYVINDILNTLGLMMCKETRCQKLSGGQKKRLSIALELIDNPPVMFLDEPTTGLDSLSSSQCISMLKNLAKGGRTIICTIHQPNATLYKMFDHVYVMAKGRCIYQGASINTVSYLASLGFNCPKYHNPADYFLEVANCEYGNFIDLLAKAADTVEWRNTLTSPKLELKEYKKENIIPSYNFNSTKSLIPINPPSEWTKFLILMNRSFVQLYRDWTISYLKIVLHFLVGMVLGLTFYKAGNDGSKSITNIGFYLVSSVFLCYTSLMPAILKLPSEIDVLKKERFNNWYNLKTYYIAFLVSDVPMQIIFCLSYISSSYFLSEQPSDWNRFFMVFNMLSLVNLSASSLGLLIGSTVNPINGTFIGAIITAVLLSVAGLLILFPHMSSIMYALTYVSFLSYAMEGLMQAVYGFSRSPVPCPENIEYCHFKFPNMILRELGMENGNYWIDTAFLLSNFVIFRIIAYFTMKRRLSAG